MTTITTEDPLPGDSPGSDAANGVAGESEHGLPSGSEQLDVSAWLQYQDDAHHFQIAYPPDYVTVQLSDAELNQLTPRPVAAVYFLDPLLNDPASPAAPPQLSIRVFTKEPQQPLEEWLPAVGLFNPEGGWYTQPYQGKTATGLAVFSSDFMAPGWFVYFTANGLVYQLTPLGTEAEAMLDTFRVLS
ncbi:MAG: hypothetical protein L0332_20065 [Chloroflexi bacterium]|nr:hypothetical protein [Chloroflexota bacterium]MCI0647804.1 hypothetical protein [Chloroflexota bacterium]MCI0728994.1 hypothetical protein [Chloroflexota bacterium]